MPEMSAEEIVPGVVTPDTSENEENTNTTPSFREINLGRIVGDSSYELAVKHGKFEGSEEEYVEKEQKVYDDMVKFCDDMKLELSGLVPLPQRVSSRMNDFGEVDLMDIDRLMELFSEDDNYHKTDDGKLSYTCSSGYDLYIGMEDSDKGVQLRLGFITGLMTRRKNNGEWGNWLSLVNTVDGEVE